MKNRVYEFVTGIETSSQPDSGTPVDPNDVVTKSYVAAQIGTDDHDSFAGPGTGPFVLSSIPVTTDSVRVFRNGIFLRPITEWSIVTDTITLVNSLAADQEIDVIYRR